MPRAFRCLLLTALIVVAGIAWRFLPLHLPYFAWKYGGSLLWAVALYFFLAALLPRQKPLVVALLAALVAVAVEYSRLLTHPAWVHFRHTFAGRLLVGNIFSPRNIVAYWLGISLAAALDRRRLLS